MSDPKSEALLPSPDASPVEPSTGPGGARAGYPFPPLNRRTVLRLLGLTLVFSLALGALFAVLVNRRGGRAASGPVIVSALPQEPAPDADAPPPHAPPEAAGPVALPFAPPTGVPAPFSRRIRFNPPILPVDTRSFEADGISVSIADMETPTFETVCFDEARHLWACGRYARAALFNRIRNGVLVCQERGKSGFWHCEHNGEDVALWMIRLGWGRPLPGSPLEYAGAMAEAKAAKAGLWNGGWTYVNLDTMGTPRGPQALTNPPVRVTAPKGPQPPADARRDRQKRQKTD